MDKLIKIQVGIQQDKIATAIHTTGYDDNKISDQLELLGVMDNLKEIIRQRINKLAGVRK